MKILVFDIGGTSIKYGVCSEGSLISSSEIPTEATLGGRHIVDTLKKCIAEESGYSAIGISTAGQVHPQKGSIIYANSNIPGYTGICLKEELESAFKVPVFVENDVNSAALGEATYGAGIGYDTFLCLTYGTGVGGAIIADHKVFHGSSFSAAEFGGIIIHGSENKPEDDLFSGCYERYASTTALVRMAKQTDPTLENGRIIFSRLAEPSVKEVVDHWIDEILLGLISLIHIFNPPCIILGGGIMAQPYILEQLQLKLPTRIMPSFAHVKLLQASLGNTAGMLGAYHLAVTGLSDR